MHCIICQLQIEHGALYIWGEAICSHCETRLMEQVCDQADYEQIIRVFRCLWLKHFFAEQNRRLAKTDGIS